MRIAGLAWICVGWFGPVLAAETLHVKGNVWLMAMPDGANVAVQVGKDPGHDGVLLVDAGSAGATSLESELRKLTREPIRFILQTSADADRVGGVAPIVAATDSGLGANLRPNEQSSIAIYATDNVLTRMSAAGSGVPGAAWPTLTFEREKDVEFNGEPVQMLAEPAAHSDADAVVFFRGSNVVVTGNIFLTTGYPVIDVARGGSIAGELRALNHLLELTVPHQMQEGGTMVIPGRGRICDEADVAEYRDMMTIIRDRVADLLAKGKSVAEAVATKPSRDYDRRYSTPQWTGDMLVEAIYKSLQMETRR
jgi:cyclase